MLSSSSSAHTNAFFTTNGQMQTVPHFTSLREARQRLRESKLTVQSGTTSSVYPLSSSTVSGTESPSSPRSIADSFQDHHISSVDPDEPYDDYQTFHTDDVSYRLRLLLSNNYFLPPAHSKPSPSDFASPVVPPHKKAAKSTAPTFLDIFRVGKARSKPTTPPGPLTPEAGPPRLRTTADSTITSSRAPTSHVEPVPRRPIVPLSVPHTSRVAVVREKVDNLALAAEQAEQELKMRVDAKQQSIEHYDNYIDPTDAVDLPPPSENSPFAFQASALRGLGVENSVGAAVLAERLPPGTPGVWSLDPDEEAWRKALLHEAVGHSLNNTPDHSFHSSSHATTPSSGSMGPSLAQSSPSPGPRTLSTPSTKRNLGQRIVDILEERHEALLHTPALAPEDALSAAQLQTRERSISTASHVSQLPSRAETPAEPQTALPLPPRAPAKLPRASMSTDSPGDSLRISQYSTTGSVLRKTSSSPMLHFWHDGTNRRSRAVVSMTPPLVFRGRASSVATSPGGFMPRDSMTSGSHYSMQEDPESIEHLVEAEPVNSRPSFSSLPSRPSVSEYSQISPTVSAFNDGHFATVASARESMARDDDTDAGDLEVTHDDEEPTRHLSPPPRASSSLAIHSLRPPPRYPISREPSPTLVVVHHPLLTPHVSVSSSDLDDSSERPSAYASAVELQYETPSFPLGQHHTEISSLSIPDSIHNAPLPVSPLEFFDQIQAGHNDLDDWESSDESDGDAGDSTYVDAVGRSTSHGSSQGHSLVSLAPKMTSTSSVSPTTSRDDLSAHTAHSGSQERSPVVNVPRPPIYFKDTKSDHSLTSYDLYRPSRSAAPPSSSRASSETHARGGPGEDRSQTKREGRTPSMQRLDGLVLQHIEAERGTMSRIARTMKDSKS